MATTLLFEERLEIPLGLANLADFRSWAASDDFPETGRIDYFDERIEVEGTPDLVVEIVSDRSVNKDTQRLPGAYFRAGVPEFWLADARAEPLVFRIHRRGAAGYEPVEADVDAFQASAVLGGRFRLEGSRDPKGHWMFDLREKG